MAAILLSAFVTCFASLFVGQATLRLAGTKEWSWLAPMVGLAVLMTLAVLARHAPGLATTVAYFLTVLTIASVVWCLSGTSHRPPLDGLLAAVPAVFLILIPFLAAGRSGILGVSVDNDLAAHLHLAEIFLTSHPDPATQGFNEYPVGPHAMSAVLSAGLNVRLDHAFTGWIVALPVLNAMTALALMRRPAWFKQVIAATVIGLPYLIAAYYGQGAFKELVQAGLVLAAALFLAGYGPRLGRGRWVPLALLVSGMLSVYSITGMPWAAMLGATWLIGVVVVWVAGHGIAGLRQKAIKTARLEVVPVAIGLGVLILCVIPQARRLHNFYVENLGGSGIVTPKDNLGNLVAPLPGWEAFGVWNSPDFACHRSRRSATGCGPPSYSLSCSSASTGWCGGSAGCSRWRRLGRW